MAVVSYLRVSTLEQTIENQRQAIEGKGYKIDKEFTDEGFTGTNTDRAGFKACMSYLREGDTLVVYSLSRLARSTKDLLGIVEKLDKEKVQLISLSENVDTKTATGKLLIGIIAVVNQFEVESLKERQRAGIDRAKREGKYTGRKKVDKPDNWTEVYSQWKQRAITGKEAMELLGLKRNVFYNFVKEEE